VVSYILPKKGPAGLVPTEDLESLLSEMGQKLKRSQMVELLSFLDSGRETLLFEEVSSRIYFHICVSIFSLNLYMRVQTYIYINV
jgi:hypothetical protein